MKKLYNPTANDNEQKLYNGETTNLLNLANVKYPKFIDLVDNVMYPNNWLPQEVDMTNDKKQYRDALTKDEKEVYNTILSFLIFLDSIQTNNLPNISEKITLPEVVYFLARQDYEEAIHSRSYGHILSTVMSDKEMNEVVYKFREVKELEERNSLIAKWYEDEISSNSFKSLVKLLIANYLLEGLYFYNGFQFFHTLASRGLMVATDTQISFIQRDELVHVKGFELLINYLKKEEPKLWSKEIEDMVYNMFNIAVEKELEFSKNIIGDKILGISKKSIEEYCFYLANKRLKAIGLSPTFPKTKNPYKHLEMISGAENETSNRTNNFEMKSIVYKSHTILDGWEQI